MSVSDARRWLAYAEDTTGRRQYVIRIRDLATGELLPDQIPATSGDIAWAADDKTLFYVENDATTLRSRRVKRHVVSAPTRRRTSWCTTRPTRAATRTLRRSGSRAYVVIELNSTEYDEQRVLRRDRPPTAASRRSRRARRISTTAPTTSAIAGSSSPTGTPPTTA